MTPCRRFEHRGVSNRIGFRFNFKDKIQKSLLFETLPKEKSSALFGDSAASNALLGRARRREEGQDCMKTKVLLLNKSKSSAPASGAAGVGVHSSPFPYKDLRRGAYSFTKAMVFEK